MTTEHATEFLTVAAPPSACFGIVMDFDRYPDWAHDIKDAQVLARDDRGRGTTVAFRAAAMGRSASYVLEYSYPDEVTVAWKLIEGDIMRSLDGHYVFAESSEGGTDITYELSVELVVPIPGFVKRRAEGKIMGTALRELKHRVESLTAP
jgi:ribosome-associated toxin RatA of RatAB toxin-antitoxin module